ncbi:MAG: CbtA family protein [Microlunatus sp.]|nr:CbtA family protein [Microlunatus sp.]MDN5772070.1 CbtA family protein [Microlunatus sp.]
MISARDFLIRGLLAGLLAAFAAFAVAYVVGEPPVRAAIALEASGGHSHGAETEAAGEHSDAAEEAPAPGEVEVPRSLQSTVGMLTGMLVAGTVLGGLIGVVSALAMGRFGRLSARSSTLAVTGIGFVTVYAVPFLLYPPNPPAVGSGDTIGIRTALFFVFLAISLIAAMTAVLVGRRAAGRLGGWYASLAAIVGYVVVMLIVMALLPTYNEVPDNFPASVLYDFRRASFLTQFTLWAVLGIVLAEFVGRLSGPTAATAERELADAGA